MYKLCIFNNEFLFIIEESFSLLSPLKKKFDEIQECEYA